MTKNHISRSVNLEKRYHLLSCVKTREMIRLCAFLIWWRILIVKPTYASKIFDKAIMKNVSPILVFFLSQTLESSSPKKFCVRPHFNMSIHKYCNLQALRKKNRPQSKIILGSGLSNQFKLATSLPRWSLKSQPPLTSNGKWIRLV